MIAQLEIIEDPRLIPGEPLALAALTAVVALLTLLALEMLLTRSDTSSLLFTK